MLSEQGPQWSDGLLMTTYLGMMLLLIAYVIGSRLVIMTLQRGFRDQTRTPGG